MAWLRRLAVPAIVVVSLAALAFGSNSGIWDPWEMNKAHLAQQVAGQAKVLVADQKGQLLQNLQAALGDTLFLAGITPPEAPNLPNRKLPEGPSQVIRLLKQVESRLDAEVFHAVVLEGSLLMQDPVAAAAALDAIPLRAPGALLVVTAPQDSDCDSLRTALNEGITEEAVRTLKDTYKLWPSDQDTGSLVQQQAGNHPFTVQFECAADSDGQLASLVESVDGYQWSRVVYKGLSEPKSKTTPSPATVSWSAPPLDYWLMALSFKAFGFSEGSARLPGLLMGLGTLLLLFAFVKRLAGRKEAIIAMLALMSIPLFWGQSKNLMGEASYVFFLTLSVLLLAYMNQNKAGWKPMLALAIALLGLLFAKGLFALLVLSTIALTLYVGFAEWKRFQLLKPTLLIAGLFLVMTALVQFPTEWTFLDHFKFMGHGFLGGPQNELRTYDYLVRNVTFAMLPLMVLLPFALLRMIPLNSEARSETVGLEVLTFLWFAIPFAMQTALLPGFAQTQFPAVPAAALALSLLWAKEEREGASRFQAWVILAIGLMLMANLLKSPAPLFNLLTGDPHFATEEGGSLKFPADYALDMGTTAAFIATIFLLFFYYVRGGDVFKTVIRFFRRPKPFAWALWIALLGVFTRLVVGLLSRYDMATTGKAASRLGLEEVAFVPELFTRRPESWMVYSSLAVLALVALARLTGLGRGCASCSWLGKPVAAIGRAATTFSNSMIALGLALGLAIAAVVDALVSVPLPAGYFSQLASHPAMVSLLCLPLLAAVVTLVLWRKKHTTLKSVLEWTGSFLVLSCWVLAGTMFRQTDMSAPDLPVLMMFSFVLLGLAWLPRILANSTRFQAVALATTVVGGLAFLVPLFARWPGIEMRAFPNNDSPYLHYLLLESRTTWGVVAMLLLVLFNKAVPAMALKIRKCVGQKEWKPCLIDRMGMWNPALWPEALQTRKVFLPVLLACSLASGIAFATLVLPSFSREVSQKHILELYYKAEDRETLGDNIFKYQKSGGTPTEDLNFYTAPLPELTGQNDLNRVLLANEDGLVRVGRSPSHPGPAFMLIRGFDPANDKNGDGNRDFAADAGIASAIDGTKVVDSTKSWTPDQWKDKLFIDSKGNAISILSNDASSLELAQAPTGGLGNEEGRRYILDSPDSANHKASALAQTRNYVVLGQEGFSNVNFTFREQSEGRHIPVLEGSNASFLLATSYLVEGEENQNRFAQATLTKEEAAKLQLKGGWINFNDQIRFLGYQINTPQIGRNEKLTVRLYFEVLAKVDTSWKVFLHMDSVGSSNRIHGDHWPLSLSTDPEEKECVGCWRTNHWRPGDVIVDEFKTDVPLGTPGGQYTMNMGLYTPGSDKRLKVKEVQKGGVVKHDGNDRVYIGSFEVN